ncbi:hypothetical protein [Sphingobium sp. YR768]|uniref:hypothetical protein n=1 Tax=Sphingobium sp. YR768 TaxID=1884365 RepID=UPI0008B0C7F5|nr:hypothetical protein [Sphingobium sp. YR768]SER23415.1 hypothetical protein SAMN05518866_10737 [Sphingobium sp. YR768]
MIHLPGWLPPSAATDVTLVLRGHKPAARVSVGSRGGDLRRWARRYGLFTSIDADGFAAISRNPATARRVIDLDRRPGRHTLALGTMLGYPPCCSRAAARVGDEGIDRRHAAMATRRFHGRFRAINPSGYADGSSRISHVPCSTRCQPSLRMAMLPQGC